LADNVVYTTGKGSWAVSPLEHEATTAPPPRRSWSDSICKGFVLAGSSVVDLGETVWLNVAPATSLKQFSCLLLPTGGFTDWIALDSLDLSPWEPRVQVAGRLELQTYSTDRRLPIMSAMREREEVSAATVDVSTTLQTAAPTVVRSGLDLGISAVATLSQLFEAGEATEAAVSEALERFLAAFGDGGIVELGTAFDAGKIGAAAAVVILRGLGLHPDPRRRDADLWLLKRSIRSPIPSVRDAALVGILQLERADAIPAIAQALRYESVPMLREEFAAAIEYLKGQEAE
jgi:hypothetical protein